MSLSPGRVARSLKCLHAPYSSLSSYTSRREPRERGDREYSERKDGIIIETYKQLHKAKWFTGCMPQFRLSFCSLYINRLLFLSVSVKIGGKYARQKSEKILKRENPKNCT